MLGSVYSPEDNFKLKLKEGTVGFTRYYPRNMKSYKNFEKFREKVNHSLCGT